MLRILMATDLSRLSDLALSRAVSLASDQGAALRIVHVTRPTASPDELADLRRRLASRWKSEAAPGLAAGVALLSGPPAEAILAAAAEYRPDLIVLGAHARMRFRDAWLGTTVTQVLRCADAPVLVVRSANRNSYRRLLAALDESTAAESILRMACRLAAGAEVFAVHAFHIPFEAFVGHGRVFEEVQQDHQRVIRGIVDKVAATFGSVQVHADIEEGDVLPVVAAAAREIDPDLLIFGTRGRRGFARFLTESVAEEALAYFELDMLVLRTGEGRLLTEL